MELTKAQKQFPRMEITDKVGNRTAAEWKEVYEYRNGKLYWKVKRIGIRIGDEAGTEKHEHYLILPREKKGSHAYWSVPRKHVIFLMHWGYIPLNTRRYIIFHRDFDPFNDAVSNLELIRARDARERTRAHYFEKTRDRRESTLKPPQNGGDLPETAYAQS